MSDAYEQEIHGERTCPCGCLEDPEKCAYASTCRICGKKYFGSGYGDKENDCSDCRQASRSQELPQWLEDMIANHPKMVATEALTTPFIIPGCFWNGNNDDTALGIRFDLESAPAEASFEEGILTLRGTPPGFTTPVEVRLLLDEIIQLAVFALCAESDEEE